MARLEGKVAIVTGAAGGIGSVTAAMVAAEGAGVVVADLAGDAAEAVAAQIRDEGGDAIAAQVDIGDESSIVSMIDAAVGRWGRLDVLHNNAAATTLAIDDVPIVDADPAVWTTAFRVNVIGTMLGIKHAVPHMLRVGGGSIVNTASGAAHHGDTTHPAYGSSKAAVCALTRYAATMHGKQGIRVNAISPGLVVPAEREAITPAAFRDVLVGSMLSPRVGRPEDIAHAVVYLASDESAFVTGQVFHVDGGASAAAGYYATLEAAGGWDGIFAGLAASVPEADGG